MADRMTVYESEDSRRRCGADLARFDASVERLSGIGIEVRRVVCSAVGDIPTGDVRDTASVMGMSALPATDYDGVCVCVGAYPSDQELADYLDVPDGVLSANHTRAPAAANDMAPHCFLRPRTF